MSIGCLINLYRDSYHNNGIVEDVNIEIVVDFGEGGNSHFPERNDHVLQSHHFFKRTLQLCYSKLSPKPEI